MPPGFSSPIALITDFGDDDTYVGVMKAVMESRAPGVTVIDLCHEVDRQNIQAAAYLMWTAYRYLPEGTITICVVDPGVGTRRRPIAVGSPRGAYVGPDNGWLSLLIRDAIGVIPADPMALPRDWQAVELTEARYWLQPVSATFHGRDIFAPVAAAIASGVSLDQLGPRLDALTGLSLAVAASSGSDVRGSVIHVDHFGNLITNIGAAHLADQFTVVVGGGTIAGPSASYQEPADLIALVGSSGLLEIAAPNASAARLIQVGVGEPVICRARGTSPGATEQQR